jgi:hypothetical protein
VLLEGIDNLSAMVAEGNIDFKVEVGSLLWDLGNAIEKAMKAIKGDVRTEAWDELGGAVGNTKISGTDLGEATVTFPKATLRIPKGKNVDDIKSAIGGDFSLFFEEEVTFKPRKEFEERVAKLQNALHKQILMDAIERKEATPRVSFTRHPPLPGSKG